ncbi:hypothetical protein IUY40_06915 [Flavobacterium sp. ALJ2]|uniref:toxin-antitoxin system YwqK family antitoxin n=1 Tax=Flavobacterium sp. ALJ2 TaxID=2786960 RepID=UPI00189CEA76|nr:hypothetical protein [Flavobacterium sp. ALJ2]MBF7091266.1 hypothetical protein [Flavobacterium sp. ALJ2]
MKKNILLIFFVTISFTSCEKKTVIDREIESLEIKPTNFSSADTIFYATNKIKSLRFIVTKTEYVNLSFYESGKKKSIGSVKNNQCHDKYIDWYENGKLKWTREYNYGNQIGKNIEYQKNGNLKQQFDNKKNETTECWENGKTKVKFIENVSSSYHYFNGNFMEKYTNKLKDEYDVEYFNENGKLVFEGRYEKNILFKENLKYNGKIICYFSNGKISLFQNIVNGIPNGKFYSSYGNGNLKYESEVKNRREIYYKSYYENGKVNFIRDGIKNKFTQWDENGNLIK